MVRFIAPYSFIQKDYENIPRSGVAENKTKRSQFHKPTSGKGTGKRASLKVP